MAQVADPRGPVPQPGLVREQPCLLGFQTLHLHPQSFALRERCLELSHPALGHASAACAGLLNQGALKRALGLEQLSSDLGKLGLPFGLLGVEGRSRAAGIRSSGVLVGGIRVRQEVRLLRWVQRVARGWGAGFRLGTPARPGLDQRQSPG